MPDLQFRHRNTIEWKDKLTIRSSPFAGIPDLFPKLIFLTSRRPRLPDDDFLWTLNLSVKSHFPLPMSSSSLGNREVPLLEIAPIHISVFN